MELLIYLLHLSIPLNAAALEYGTGTFLFGIVYNFGVGRVVKREKASERR